MATIAPPPPELERREPYGGAGDLGHPGNHGGGGGSPQGDPSSRRYYTGMLVALGGISMLFVAFTSAYVVRKGLSSDWEATPLPAVLWVSTGLLLGSSWTLEKARKSLSLQEPFLTWWAATTALGVLFLAGQLAAWWQLRAAGLFISTNPSSSFFYVLTGAHGVHLVGGVTALLYLSWKFTRGGFSLATPQTAVGVMSIYWHFMDALWVYLFLLLLLWR